MKRPIIISVFGIDGSGKTTQSHDLQGFLTGKGYDVAYVWSRREPFILKPLIKFVKRFLLKERKPVEHDSYIEIAGQRHKFFSNAFTREVWFWASLLEYRLLLCRRVLWPYRGVDIVICDRYIVDALVDIATNYNVDADDMQRFFRHPAVLLFPKPAVSLFIDVPAKVGAARKSDGTSVAYLSDRVALYQSAAKIVGAFVVDGTRPPGDLAGEIREMITEGMST